MSILTRRWAVVALSVVLAACSATAPTGTPAGQPTTAEPSVAARATTAEATAATPTVTPLPPQRTAIAGVDWELRDVWFENPDGRAPSLEGAIFVGSGFLAWGPNALGSAIVASANGLTSWGQAGSDGQFDGIRIIGMAWAPAGVVALGADKAGGVHAWRSPDGITWTAGPSRTGIDGTVLALISTGVGAYIAAGTAKGGCDVAIWMSHDGFSWSPSGPLAGAHGTCVTGSTVARPAIAALQDGGAGLLAIGFVPGVGNATWTSADRVHWSFHPEPAMRGHVAALVSWRGGYLAVGDTGTGSGAAWTSRDGAAWTPAPDQGALRGASLLDARSLADGTLVAVGADAAGAFTTWTSADGLGWVRGPAALYDGGWLPSGRVTRLVLATDGHATTNPPEMLLAAAGGSRIWVSPSITLGLRAVTLTITDRGLRFSGVGRCHGADASTNDIPPGGVDVLARWVEPGDVGQSSPYASDGGGARRIDLTVGPDGSVLSFTYEDPVGRSFAYGGTTTGG
ncbi:MAG: hypothetical protein ACHQZR_09565, partial [Candidatus Limnocylindrales bacterium]